MKKICGGCENKMYGICCISCGWVDEEERLREKAKLSETVHVRKKRVSKEFTIDFDKKMLEFALKLLEFNKKLLIKDLVDLFDQEGLFSGLDQEAVVIVNGEKKYFDWSIKFTLWIAKKWHAKGEVFIGTRQIKGHPYEIYLPEESEKRILENQKMIEGNAEINPEFVIIPFGKWKGESVQKIMQEDPGYIRWMFEKCVLRDGLLKSAVEICAIKLKLKKDGLI